MLAQLAKRLLVIDEGFAFAPSELEKLLAQQGYALAKIVAGERNLLLARSAVGLVAFECRVPIATRALPKHSVGKLEALCVVRGGVG